MKLHDEHLEAQSDLAKHRCVQVKKHLALIRALMENEEETDPSGRVELNHTGL